MTGVRRCGKSYLLFNLFYDHLIGSGVSEDNIIRHLIKKLKKHALKDIDKGSAE